MTTGGWLAHASEAYFGRASDDDVLLMSKLMDDLVANEAMEADRGYTRLYQLFLEQKKRLLTPQTRRRKRKDDEREAGPDDKEFTVHDNIKTAHLAHRRIIVEHWNSVIERWALGVKIPHDMSHMVTYIQWAIMFLAVLHDPPHPVTEGDMAAYEESM